MRAYQFIPCIFCFFVKSSDYRMRAIFILIDLILYHVSHIPLGACVAIAKAGYPPSGFSFDSFHLPKRQTGLTHGPQFRNSFDPCVVHANESRIIYYMIHFQLCRRIHQYSDTRYFSRYFGGKVSNTFHPFEMIVSIRLTFVILL